MELDRDMGHITTIHRHERVQSGLGQPRMERQRLTNTTSHRSVEYNLGGATPMMRDSNEQ